jgi:DNA-binding transcriptional ArsR family regulator
MDSCDTRRYKLRAEMFKALAHPMRLLMLEKLKERPWCVCELAAEVGIEKSVASKHLSQLKDVGIIEDEKRGTLVEYSLVAPCVLEMGACAEKAIVKNQRKRLDAAK